MIKPSAAQLKEKFFHPGFQRYFQNTGWMFFGQAFNMAVAFFVGAYVARYLGPANFGLMSYAISFASLFGFLAGLGIDNILNRELIKYPENRKDLLGTGFWLKILGAALAVTIIGSVSSLINYHGLTRLLILIYASTFFSQSLVITALYFQAQVLSRKVIRAQLIMTIISTAAKLAVIYLGGGVIWLTAVYILDSLAYGLGLIIIYRKSGNQWFFNSFKLNLAKSILRDSWPLMLTAAAVTIYSKIDQVFIKGMLGDAAVGLYAVPAKLTEIFNFIPAIICASLFPALINAKKDSKNYGLRLKRLVVMIGVISIATAIIASLAARPLIVWLFGPAYIQSITIFRIYIWSIVPSFIMVVANYYLIAENLTRTYLAVTAIGAITNIALNLYLIPRLGMPGGALATLISYSLVMVSLALFPGVWRNLRQ